MRNVVLTLIGPDRPGLVEALAQPIAGNGGNWLESRMAHLGGKFAGILRIEVADDHLEKLVRDLRELERQGLRVLVEEGPAEVPDEGRHLMELNVEGLDRPGIVREISHVLAGDGINIEELSTERTKAAMSGEGIFRAQARVDVPASCDAGMLRVKLERLAADLMVQVKLAETD